MQYLHDYVHVPLICLEHRTGYLIHLKYDDYSTIRVFVWSQWLKVYEVKTRRFEEFIGFRHAN